MRILLFTLVCVIFSCKTRQVQVNPDIGQICFGTGGGFTGAREEYILSGSGNLFFIKSFENDTVLIKKCSPEEKKAIFDQAAMIREDLNIPSNMYRFISIKYSADSSRNLLWPIQGYSLPYAVYQLDSLLTRLQLP